MLAGAQWDAAESVFLYVSMWAEPDTRALLEDALAAGKRVYVPLCCPDRVMKAVRIRSTEALRPGMCGIPEPFDQTETASAGELDLLLVPCLTASRDGKRLGHGAGYYDRFLSGGHGITMCLCYEALLTETIPTDAHDVRMDFVQTEKQLYPTV